MYTLAPSTVFTQEDIDQEIALFTFERGTRPRRSFIEHRLNRQLGGLSLSYEDPEALDNLTIPFVFEDSDQPEGITPEDVTRLLNWSTTQPEEVQINIDIVLGFEEGDTAEALTALFAHLNKKLPAAPSKPRAKAVAKSSNIRALITTLLTDQGPLTREAIVDQLLVATSTLYQSRRPAAAIRQALRSLTAEGTIVLTDNLFRLS